MDNVTTDIALIAGDGINGIRTGHFGIDIATSLRPASELARAPQ